MKLQRRLVHVLLIDQHRRRLALDKVGDVVDAAGLLPRRRVKLAAASQPPPRGLPSSNSIRTVKLIIVILAVSVSGLQRLFKRRQRHRLVALRPGRNHRRSSRPTPAPGTAGNPAPAAAASRTP